MLISSILVLGLHAAFRQTQYMISQTEKIEPHYRQARLLTDLWRQELFGLYLPPPPTANQQNDQENNSAHFLLSYQPDTTLELSYLTLNPAWQQDATSAKPAKVRYQLVRNEESETFTLTRAEQPYAGQLPIGPENKARLVHNLKSLSFTVFDPQQRQWQPLFQADQTLPQAIRVTFQFAQPTAQNPLEFSTTFFIPPRHARQ